MRNHWYLVDFSTGELEWVWASGKPTAIILAQARQILKGNDYIVISVEKREG